MIKEAIILAGGLGTRLKEAVPHLPKCMAPVAGRPFLFYVINYLRSQGIEQFIFSLGYKHELIEEYLNEQFATLNFQCVVESEPLGTGGAIKEALSKASERNVVIANGDTIFRTNLQKAGTFHDFSNADCTLLLKPMKNFDRYGVVEINNDNLVTDFKEKKYYEQGTINCGLYILKVSNFMAQQFPEKFSFEKDYLERSVSTSTDKEQKIFGQIQDEYFIDIGIPEDYNKAQIEFATTPPDLKAIDKSWTLFIDRDGVINHEKKDDYILNWREFIFYDGAKESFQQFSQKFGQIIIVSNQRGVGKELMTEAELRSIHRHMETQIISAGGRIDKIYYCTSTDNKHPNRKPNPGMAFLAKADFPAIDLAKSLMVGNKPSDMLFGRNAGIFTVFTATTNPNVPFPHPDIDFRFDSLADFAKAL